MSVQDELLTVWAHRQTRGSPTPPIPRAGLSAIPTTGTPPSSRPCGMTPGRCATRSKPSRRRSTAPRRRSRRHRPALRAVRRPVVADHPGRPPRRLPAMEQINWKWVRRGLYVTVAALIVLPIVTFGMAYLIVDVPKPGDIRTNQVSTILASDGSELAKIVPPEGNRVDVNIDQIPVHVRDAVMAAEDRDFYSNPGFSFTGFARAAQEQHLRRRHPGRVDDHPAVRQERVGRFARSGLGGIVRKAKELVISTKMSSEWSKDQVLQSLSEHHLLRPRRLRHRRRVQGLLRQAGRTAHGRRRRAAGRAHPAALRAGPRGQPGRRG